MNTILIRRRFTITNLTVCIHNCYYRLLIHHFTGDPKTEDIVRNGYLQIYIDPGVLTSIYGLCSLVRVRNQDSDKIHIILFDKPSSTTKISVSNKKYTFYELSYIDEFLQDKYVPNPPKLTMSLISQLIRRRWNPPGITELLYTIISLHANTNLIQEIINSNLQIDWGYINSKGNTFLHKACIHPLNAVFLQIIIQNVTTHNNQLINHSNNVKQTPLALLIGYIYDNHNYYSTYQHTLKILLENDASILIQDTTTQMMRPIMENFTIQQHNQSLVITFTVQQTRLYTNWSMYALFSKPDEIFVIKTGDLISFSQEDFISIVLKKFNIILDLNCPEILDYIFGPKNSISKTNINQSQSGESFLNIAAGECNSPLLFKHFIQDIIDWNPKNPNENILHICLSKKKYENFYILLNKIPSDYLNKLLFTINYRNEVIITSMIDIPNTEKCTQIIIKKGCLDYNGNNLAHIAISNKKYDFLRIVIKCSQNNTFTHKNKDGFNPLHLAIQKSSIEATLLLLENSDKLILTSTDNDGYNCLHSAIIHFNIDIFKAVLSVVIKCDAVSEEKIINIKTKDTTKTPFLLSIEKQCLEATRLLLSSGVSIDIQDSRFQYYPYYIQIYCLNKDSLQKILGLRVNQCNSSTLKSECCIEDLSFNSSPLLFYFWQYQDLDRFKEICAAFSFRNLVKCNQDGNTSLHLSLYNDKLTEYFLEVFSRSYNDHKEETISFLDITNKKCETSLFLAVTHSKPEAVWKILKLGASLKIEFPGGDNILHIAIRIQNKETIAIFLCHLEIGQLLCKPNDKNEIPITSLLKSDGTGAIHAITNAGRDIHGPNGELILHLVVQNGDEQTLLELIKSKRSSWSNLKDNNQRTPLHYAVEFSRAYAIKLLVERGYDIFTPDDKGNTPIQEAITRKNKEVWKEMFKILMSPNHVSQLPILLQFSVEMNNLIAMKNIFSRKPDLTPDNDKNSIIHLAAKLPEQAAILEYLLQTLSKEKSHHMLQSLNKDQLTPLHYAVYLNNVKGAKILIENGSSIAVPFKGELSFFSKKFEGRMVLCKACHTNLRYLFGYSMKQGMENMYILTEIPKLKSTDIYKVGALSRVTGLIPSQDLSLFFNSSCIDLISYLIHHNHVKFIYQDGITLLHYAAQFGTINIIRYLIGTHKCKLFTLDKHENSILYYALQNQDHDLLKDVCQLITTNMDKVSSKQINLYETPNSKGKRILEICLDSRNIKGFKHLVELVSDLLYFDMKGLTLLYHIIYCKQREEFIGLFIEKLKNKDKVLCTKCINLSTKDDHKLAPLHVAVLHGSNNIVNILLQNGATPDVVNTHKQNALHYAVSRKIPGGNLKLIISSLLKYPKLLEMKDQNGQTPIFYCIDKENIPALTLLIEHPIDFHDEDKDKKTVMDHSIEKKSPEIWRIIFPKFLVAIVESKYIVTSTLKHLLQACMNKCNEVAFNDLLGLHLCTTFVEQEWRALIEFSITHTNVTFFLAEIISHLKTHQRLDLYFYPESNEFTPPLLLAIQRSKMEAIKLMIKENISLSFIRSDKCLTLYSENCSTPLVICIHKRINTLLTGYKIVNSSPAMYVLVNLPVLGETNIYEHPEVTELKDLSIPNLTLILKSPCIEPIKSVIDLPSRYTYNHNKGSTLMHLAAEVASIEVLRYLLYNNSKITELDQDLNSVLYFSLFNEIPDIFEILCNYLVDKLNYFKLFDCENASGKRILDICIEKRDLSSFCILLNPKYKVKLDYTDSRGYTLFHRLIILKTSVKFFKQLHKRTHSTNEYRHLSSLPAKSSKLTSLHLAISENLHEHIEFILEQNYDMCVQSKSGSYPIHVAVLKNLEKERINKIITAIPKEKVSLVLNARDNEGFSPILLATRNGNVCTVEELLKRESIKIDAVDNLGRNSLHHSTLLKEDESNLELLKLFLKNKTLMKQKDSKGLTPLHYCVIQDNIQALALVLQNDKDILNESEEKKNLIHFAIESNSNPVWKRIFKELECSKDPKAIIEAKLNDQTILVYCIKKNNLTAFNDILTLTPDIDAVDSEGNTPLHHAAEDPEQSKILTSLIEYIKGHYNDRLKQLFSILNNDNLAPFHYAIWKNNLSAIDIFICHKAPFVIKKNSKLTLCALNSPLSINLYSSARNNQLMIGYKVTPKSPNPPVCILSQIPDMKRDAILKVVSTSIAKIDKLTDFHIKTILQCPSAEPVIAFLNQKLIQEDRKFDNGCSLLLYSAMYGTLSVVNKLCKRMDLSFTDQNTETILFYALKNKDTEVLTFLLNTVIELSKQSPSDILNAENKKGERILEVALNNFERFSILLDGKFKIILTYTNPNGDTLLHTIMRSKTNSKFLTALLNEIQTRKPDCLNKFINIFSKDLRTALHLCICNNLESNLRELLKFSPNITCQDQNENTPLHIASELNFKSLVTILIEHVKSIQGDYPSFINAVNKEKMTPLHLSIISSNLEISKELLTAGAELYATDNYGKSVLHHAVLIRNEIKREKAIDLLFQQEKVKADPERKLIQIQDTSDNDSPLHLAVLKSNNKTIQLLLKGSPDLTLCDRHKKSVLHQAITKGHLEIIHSILDYIIQAYPKERSDPLHVLNLQDEDGNTPLHLSINSNRADILKELLPLNPLMDLKNNSGQTPLHLAVFKKPDILNDILEEINKYSEEKKDSHLYALDNTGLPPLHSAIVHNNLKSVRALIDFGAGLAWHENKQHITLFNDTNGLSLCFSKLKVNNLNIFKKMYSHFTEYDIFVGYQMVDKKVWIAALLPDLLPDQTKLFPIKDVEQLTTTLEEAKMLKSIVRCASIEPIKVGIQKGLIDDQKLDSEGNNWLKNFVISENGHKNVRKFLIIHNSSTKDLCTKLRTGIRNNDCFDAFEDVVEFIPVIRDAPESENEDIREISRTLLEVLPLSLENDKIDSLKKLLSLNPLLTHLYGENNDSTLLHLMVEKNKSSEFLEEYLEKVKIKEEQNPPTEKRLIDSKNSNSMTVLNLSIKMKQLKNIKTILSYKPNISSCDAFDNSILHFATKTSNLEIAQLITNYISNQNPSYSFDLKNSDGSTPLHLATESGNVEICELLLAKGADCYSTDNTSKTILHNAISIQDDTQRKSMIEFILQNTVNSDNKIVRMPDNQSCIPLQCAVVKRQVSVVELLVPFTDTIKHRNIDEQTALHLSCIHRCNIIVDLILEGIKIHGDKNVIDLRDKNSKTALHLSIDNKNHYALERLLTAGPNLELIDASKNNYLHNAVEVVDDPFFLRTILTNLSEDTIQDLRTRLNSVELPPLQYAILNKNYLAADILVGKGATLDFQKEGKSRLCDDTNKLKLKVVEYRSQCWVGFEIQIAKESHFVITQLPSLEGDIYVSVDESHNIKPYNKETIKQVMQHICECKSSDPFNNLLQNGLISLEDNFQQIGKFATKEVIRAFFDSSKNALYHQASGESMIESAVSNPNLDAFEFLLSNLPEFQQKYISSANPSDSKDAQISLCVKNSLRKSLSNTNTKILKSLLKKFTKINYLYPNEETLIHLAISRGNSPDFLEAIFEKVGKETDIDGISLINKQSKDKKHTALHICIANKQNKNLEVLMRNSADPFLCDSEANTALHYSVLTNDLNFVETIFNATLEKAKLLQQPNADNHSALHLAVKRESPEIVDFLLTSSSPFYPIMDKEPTLLHLAIRIRNESAQTEIMNQLFKHEDVGHVKSPMTRLKDDRGYPPLHLATDLRNNNAVTLLLKVDPSVLYIQDTRGHTPLHISLIQSTSGIKDEVKYFSIFETIIGKILSLRDENPDFLAQNVITPPLHEETPCTCKVDKVFCTQDKHGRTAMHYAIQYGRIEAFKQLLNTKSCLFIPDEDGYTLQHEAVKNGSDIQFLELLEEELMARTGGSHLDCFRFETDPMDQTKSHQVPHCKPKYQLSPLQLAIKENNFTAIESLLKRNYGIAFEDNENHVILSEDEKDLPIQLLYISNWRFNKTFHVGFRYIKQSQIHWVVADLPGLEKVRIVAGSKVHTITTNNIQEMILPLVQCRSPRPLFAAFRGLIEPDAQLKNKSFLRDLVCKSGSEQVVVEYITEFGEVIFKEIDKFLTMIESAINNPKVLGYLLTASSNLQTSDSFNPAHKQLISKCLCKCLELSIECNGVAALQILLLHHSCVINSLYEEKSDTLLQLALRKKGKIEFIKCILKALSDKTEINLTHIKDKNSEMIPLIDWKNTDNHTALHICVQNECKEDIEVNTAILEELLYRNARINYTDEGADTIVHFIVKERKAPILASKILMKIHHISDHALTHFGNIPFLDAKDKDGKTAIHICIEDKNKDLLKVLLNFVHDPLSQDPNGDTALHLAVYTQDLEFVEIVVITEPNIIEVRNKQGYTALHCAIDRAENTIADNLLKCGADFFTTDNNEQNILHHAIKLPNAHCKQMIDYIIAYNNEPIITKMFDKDRNCPLHLAVISQNIIAVKTLLDWDYSILCCKEKDNRSVLHLVFVTEPRKPVSEEILDYILEKIKFLEENAEQRLCNRVIDYQDNLQKSVLHYCILHNNGAALMKLLALSPNLGLKDHLGNTPLHRTVLDHEHVSLLQPLLDSIEDENGLKYSSNLSGFRSPNITCQDQNENTPLHIASELNYKSLVTILIEHVKSIQGDYPSFINAVNKEKMTPLHLSIISSNLEISKELLTAGAELYATDNYGRTVLHYAVLIRDEIKREKAIDLLFQQEKVKADPERKLIQIQDTSNSDSPLHLAVLVSNNKIIQLLLKESPDLTLCDKHKKSVLHQAITKGHLEIPNSILDYIIKTYPRERSDPLHVLNLQDEDGNTALHLAINGDRADILKELLPLNPLLNLKNNSGRIPLHLAVFKKPDILNDILEEINKYSEEKKESYFYALDNTGLPPLHSAIVHNHLQSVRALIDSGAGLAWHKNDRHITLFSDTNGLSLCFCRLKKANTFKIFITHFTVNDIFVGYQMIDKNVWVVTLLPGLTQTCVFPIQDIEQLTTTLEETYILKSIVKCASTEPIKVGIQKRQIDDQKLDSEGNNWLKNFVISENGHKNVKTFVTFHNSSSRDLCAKLRTGIRNNDCFDVFEDVVEFIPVIRDAPESENEDIREISRTLLEVLPLSLENDQIDSLKKLLSLNPLLTHLYGENNDSTLLHLMVEKNKSSEFLEEYLEKVKIKEEQNPPTEKRLIDSKNSNSMTVLNLSIKMKQLKNIKTILSYKPNISSCDAFDNSILHFATKTSNLEIAQLITNYISNQNPSYSFDLKNSDGCTPLHLATESGNVEICELLLAKGADCYSTDNTSKTILHNAISIQDDTQRKSMIEFILQNTVNSDNKIVRMPDNQSCIPLQCAVAKGQVSVVELLVPFTDTIKHRNIDKQTALHLSCIHRCDKIVDLIVEEIKQHEDGNVIDLREKNMKTALHLSIDNKNHHALEKVLKAKPNLELIDASKNNYLHNAIEVLDDPFFLRTILTNLSEDSIQNLFTRLNSVELPPLQYAILNKNYLAADILVGKGAKLDFQKEGKSRLCDDTDKLKLKVVEYKSQCWVGFEIQIAKESHFVITQLPSLEGDAYVSVDESHNIKPYNKETIKQVMQHICECKSSDPFNNLLQNGLISLEDNFQQIGKFATKEVIRAFFDSSKNALYHQSSGESMIESAVSNPNLDAFEFLLSNLPEFQQKYISSTNPTDSIDAQISLCVKNSLRKSLSNTNTKILKPLLKRFTKINYLYPNEETLIHLAISQGNSPDFLEAIFQKVGKDGTETDIGGINLINKQSKNRKQTALHICITRKQKGNLNILLNNSADLFLCDSKANTALHYSVLTNDLHFVETVYNATKEKSELLQQTNADNHSALHLAVKGENSKIVDFLLRSSSPFYPVMDKEPILLHLAIRIRNESAQTEIMNQLFKHENAGHNKFPMTRLKDDRGYPPLHSATDLRNNNAVTLLLKTDPSVLYIQDTRGHTPLHISLIQTTSGIKDEVKDFSIFKTIFDNIPAPCGKNLDLPLQDKDTIIPPLYAKTPCCPSCHVNKVICTQDNRGRTAMHYVIQYGRLEAFKQLLTTRSCIFLTDEDGYTLQHEAVRNGSDIQFMKLLEEELTTRTDGQDSDCSDTDTDNS